jgi:hypothetical protein
MGWDGGIYGTTGLNGRLYRWMDGGMGDQSLVVFASIQILNTQDSNMRCFNSCDIFELSLTGSSVQLTYLTQRTHLSSHSLRHTLIITPSPPPQPIPPYHIHISPHSTPTPSTPFLPPSPPQSP